MRKNVINQLKVVDDGDMSSDIASTVIDTQTVDNLSIHAVFTGTPTGTFTVEVDNTGDDANFTALDFDTAISASGSAGDHNIAILVNPYSRLRLNYAASSGTGTLNAWVSGKQN